ncbi:MAG: hypothetical protein LQ346_008633 [Caloplaca aetnensis]|nr:MAG: hypothetical protein LQ346_008633 [Caloplaca aetnensis]
MPDFTLSYHMTRSPIGLIFSNYEYFHFALRNQVIEQTVREAAQKINYQLVWNPDLAHQTLNDEWTYAQEEHGYLLRLVPDIPDMTYGDIPIILAVISTWATQYAGVECDIEIWARPGTSAQRKLGIGQLTLASYDPDV